MKTRKLSSLILSTLLGATMLFTACEPKEPETLSVSLTPDMVFIEGLKGTAEVVIDNKGKKIDISLAYEDRESLSVLPVLFDNLPTGVTINPASKTYDFSNNARHNITVTKDGLTTLYSLGTSIMGANPRFIKSTLNGIATTGAAPNFSTKLPGSTDLTKVIFRFEISPDGTIVEIQNATTQTFETIQDSTAIDFSDKANGRNFKLTCNGISNTYNIKVITTGFSAVEAVWAKFANVTPADTWYSVVGTGTDAGQVIAPGKVPASPSTDAWERNIAMDDNFIYMPRGNKGFASRLFGVYAVSIANPSNVVFLDTIGMKNGNGAHMTTDANVIPNNSGNKLLVCNLANAANNELKVWAWDCKTNPKDNNPAVEVLNYNVGTTGARLGDKFTIEGTWQNGRLIFLDYNLAKKRYFYFTITNGVVSQTPVEVALPFNYTTGSCAGGVYKFSDAEYLISGSGMQAAALKTSDNSMLFQTTSANFPVSQIGDCFVEYNDQKYLAFLMFEDTNFKSTLRFVELNHPTLAESLEKWNLKATNKAIQSSDGTSVLVKNGNSTGKVITRTINGTTYVACVSTNHGLSLFKLQ